MRSIRLFPFATMATDPWSVQGRSEEARAELQHFANGNKTSMPVAELAEPRAGGESATLADAFRVPVLRSRMLVLLLSWCVVSIGYYGVSMALDSLGGSIYVNFFAISAIEFPAYVACIAVRTLPWPEHSFFSPAGFVFVAFSSSAPSRQPAVALEALGGYQVGRDLLNCPPYQAATQCQLNCRNRVACIRLSANLRVAVHS